MFTTVVHLLKRNPLCNNKLASLEGDNLVVFYYVSGSEIWLYKRGGLP